MSDNISEAEFEKIIYDNQRLIIKVCNIYYHNQTDRDELFQDIVINLWKGLNSFKGDSKISTWIYRVGLNTAISKLRKKDKINFVSLDNIPVSDTAIPGEDIDNEYRIKALYFGINKLKPVEKAIVLLYLEDKSYDEISDIIGISKKNVSVRLVRLKSKLEKIIKPLLE